MGIKCRVEVWLKKGIHDAEGKAVEKALRLLELPIARVSVGKVYELEVDASSPTEAECIAREACRRLLVNPVVNDHRLSVEGA